MTNIKHNKAVENTRDLQNLVTGTILQMHKDFTQDRIEKTVNRYLKGSKFHNDLSLIKEYVTNTLDVFQNCDVVRSCNGIYSKRMLP